MKKTSIVFMGMTCLMIGCSSGSHDKASRANKEQIVTAPAPIDPSSPPSASNEVTKDEESSNNLKFSGNVAYKPPVSSSAAVDIGNDSTHKFIRTADIKFKAKSVVNTTYQIEDVIKNMGGYVQDTKLSSNIDYTNVVAISEDSSLEMTYFTVVNKMTLRVPVAKLDTTLKSIAPLIDYLNYRNIKAENVALTLMANKFAQKRAERHNERMTKAVDEKGKKVSEITTAEDNITDKQEQADNATLANMELNDKIALSTINLEIYQRQDVKREVVANNKNIDAYRPSIFHRLRDALVVGWELLVEIVVGIAHLWALIILGVIVFMGVRWYIRKNKAKV